MARTREAPASLEKRAAAPPRRRRHVLARLFPRAEVEVIPGSWEVSGLRGTGSFDWTVSDFFLPKRRTMVHAGVPLDNQWAHWPGITYALPAQAWVGPHQCAVITGLARAGIDALVELAADKTPRGRTGRLCDKPTL